MRVVVADDSVLLREGIVRLLEEAGFEVVGQAGDADDLLRKVGAHKPDVAVVDIRMPPDATPTTACAPPCEIRAEHPDTGVLVLSQYVEEGYALELVGDTADGVGYLLKDRVADVERFIDAVRRVADGGSALDPEVVAQLLGRARRDDPLDELTPREREALGLMAEGRSNPAIAEQLVVTERAVEKHVTCDLQQARVDPRERGSSTGSCSSHIPQSLTHRLCRTFHAPKATPSRAPGWSRHRDRPRHRQHAGLSPR